MRKNLGPSLLGTLSLAGFYFICLRNRLLFQNLTEIFSLVMAGIIFTIAWHARFFLKNNYLLIVGIGALFVGGLDLVDAFTYPGMQVFTGIDSAVAGDLYIAARYLQSISLLIAPLFFRRRLRPGFLLAVYAAVCLLLIVWHAFPEGFMPASTHMPFIGNSQLLILPILLGSIGTLAAKRRNFDPAVLTGIVLSIIMLFFSALSDTLQADPVRSLSPAAHLFNATALWCLYRVYAAAGIRKPYERLRRDLKEGQQRYGHLLIRQQESEQELQKAIADLNALNQERNAELFRAKELLESIIEEIPVMLCFYDSQGRIKYLNNAFESILGWDLEAAQKENMLASLLPDPAVRREAGAQLRDPACGWHDLTIHTRDGHDLETSWATVELSDRSVIAIGIDITERKEAEAQLVLYMDRLEHSNRELENFAFIASHDLQEPLRKIRAFGDMLAARSAESIDATGRDYIDRMQKAAARMQDLIDSLLNYSRVNTKATPFSSLDLNEVVRTTITDLEFRLKETGASIRIADLPTIEADSTQMIQLFQNLIGNAVKFHREGASPLVKIYCRPIAKGRIRKPRGYDIFIEDDGIGFDEKYLDRIFDPFQRLHGRDRYSGVGMGLAICRKIVKRHSGAITARSAPGKGATFIVTLPAKQPTARKPDIAPALNP